MFLYLKSLEIQGFKSFPEKTRLTFEKPITGIVGPNGSGKSNISDALLWVMGEQSTRTLRGGKMEDVIFGGTQRRSQVGFAEVTLILDNTDGRLGLDAAEIMLTRRYYRSGESEYYINRSLVRLKDISEILMDTGLGREGYSVIGQGKISEILSTKSKDRRDIFEEAAGISRYRHRKEESERKLQQTEENLVRIGDKVSELELQIDPLREQAEVAKRYLLLRDELRGVEIAVWLRELDTLKTRADKAETDHITAKKTCETAKAELDEGYDKLEVMAEKSRECDVESESVHELISGAESRQGEIESDAAVLRSTIESNITQIERISSELSTQDAEHDGVGEQISEREIRLTEINSERNSLDEQASALNAELQEIAGSAGESAQETVALMKSESDNQAALSDTRAQLSALASQAQVLFDTETSVKHEHAAALDCLSERAAGYEECRAGLAKAKEDVLSLGNVADGLTLRLQNRVRKEEEAGEKRNRLSLEIKSLENRRSLLAEMEKEYRGYSAAVKLVMQEFGRGSLKNIHGTVGSLIKTGDRYAVAIETALGGAMQNIITDTAEDAKNAINLLKRRDGGRATFLPISTIKGNVLSRNEAGNGPGVEGLALELVEYDPVYSGVYASLLGRVVIADNLNNAIRIAESSGHRFKIVTLDGQVINAGGSMTGGSAASNAGVLSRANELEQLQSRIGSQNAEFLKTEREYAECLREKNAAEYELATARAELREAEDRLIRQEGEESHFTQLVEAAKASIESFDSELLMINQKIAVNSSETESAKEKIQAYESFGAEIKARIDEAIKGRDRLAEERDRVNEAVSELRAGIASLEAEKDELMKSVSQLTAIRAGMIGSRERQLEAIEALKAQNTEIRLEIQDKEKLLNTARKEITSYKQRLTKLNEKKLSLEAERTSKTREYQTRNNEITNLELECSRLEQRKATAQLEEKQIIDKLWDIYELSRSAAVNASSKIDNVTEAQKRISSLKRQISELGSPNIGAIEEFERVNTRYSFLTTQRDDVEKAKAEILGIISEITNQMKDIFIREFNIINESFEKTFRELFGGGHATLELEDSEDVLGCGIEIHVQPPGKSLKTLTLLSGGEKAFVAIAIYFAILTVRPPPFVVMDEIEAALDDVNVLRFATHLRRMSNNTQMIVITHKRATMEESDVLYGVTMQELGVSNILRIDLEEAERHITKAKS